MHIIALSVENYGPFKGWHRIHLGPSVYGVTGRHADDPGRSNWLGKSWTLGAARYALYGAHDAPSDDATIHRGEKECTVTLELDTGALIVRKRKVGKSTQLTFTPKTLGATATQKRAQELINDYMKMDLADFDASCFIEQKQIARMVTASPADRTKIVNAWMELGPLQEAAGYSSDHLRSLLASKSKMVQATWSSLEAFEDFDADAELAECAKLGSRISGMVELRRILKTDIQAGLDWERESQRAESFEELLVQGKAKAEEVAAFEAQLAAMGDDETLETNAQGAAVKVHDAALAYSADKTLSEGEFDNQCPVMKSTCPASAFVVESKGDAKRRLPTLKTACETVNGAYDKAMTLKTDRSTTERLLADAKRILDSIRERANERADAADFIAEYPEPTNVEGLQAREEKYDDDISNLKSMKARLETRLALWDEAKKAAVAHVPAMQKIDNEIRTAQEAVAILGRGGAQKEIASTALAEIETLANGLLSSASIDLTLAVRWAREGKGLATHCDACGTPFGTSARVKVCTQCNAARGPKMIEKLELELSNRSGAADDMAGLAFQLAASSWLRKKRGSDWSVVFIDEPFGALDETNARNLSSHLHTLIRGAFGFEQGFLVAHSASIMGAMPARVVVSSDGVSSSLGVE